MMSSSGIKHTGKLGRTFLPMRQSCSILSGAEKFCLASGLRQLICDVKHDVRTLNFRSDVTFAQPQKTQNDVQKRSLCDVKCHR